MGSSSNILRLIPETWSFGIDLRYSAASIPKEESLRFASSSYSAKLEVHDSNSESMVVAIEAKEAVCEGGEDFC